MNKIQHHKIPGPPTYPVLGSIEFYKVKNLHKTAELMLKKYGKFIRICPPLSSDVYYCTCDVDVIEDMLARPETFPKIVGGKYNSLTHIRKTADRGLFTAHDHEELWAMAHRVLLPAFNRRAMKQYFAKMVETTDELLQYLSDLNTNPCLVTDVMARVTSETIAYAGFSTRFDSLQKAEKLPPFVKAMVHVLYDSGNVALNALPSFCQPWKMFKRWQADRIVKNTVDTIIQKRQTDLLHGRKVPNDILQLMLTTRDRVTNQYLPHDNIRHQLITFLIAGYETTGVLLSYALYELAQLKT